MNTNINLRRAGVAYSSKEAPRTLTGDGEQDGGRVENVPPEKGTDQEKGALCAAHRKEGLLGSGISGRLPKKGGLRRGA